MSQVTKFVKYFAEVKSNVEHLRLEMVKAQCHFPRLSLTHMESEIAYIDPSHGCLIIPLISNSGGFQPRNFDRDSALKLAAWIQKVYGTD